MPRALVCHPFCVFLSAPLTHYHCLALSLSISLYPVFIPPSLPAFLKLSLSLSLFHSLSLSLVHSLSLSRSLPLSRSPSLSLSFALYIYIYISESLAYPSDITSALITHERVYSFALRFIYAVLLRSKAVPTIQDMVF